MAGNKTRGGGGRGGGGSANVRSAMAQFASASTTDKLRSLRYFQEGLASGRVPAAQRADAREVVRRMERQLSAQRKAAAELRELRRRQQALYQGRLTTGDRKRAGVKYGQLKGQERSLLSSVGLSASDDSLLLGVFR